MQYRREIDGLRAVAVLPVILGHAHIDLFKGGYVGVDIFFVISGFLITSILLNDIEADRFSIRRFYERRVRRILPALFLVMLATTPFAYLWMMPEEFKNYGQSVLATSIFSNNILLALTSGYWDIASQFKPMLHTWSLGVEEQYYVVFPFCLLWIYRYARRYMLHALIATLVVSLAIATIGVTRFQVFAFYLLPTRSWELFAGAILAYWQRKHGTQASAPVRQWGSLAGLAMIAFAVVVFDETYQSPGPWLMIPVAGAILLIAFAVEGTVVHRLLSSAPMVAVGLISYSLYLWHQPLFAMARVHEAEPLTPALYGVLIAATFVLAYLTWRYVETPFRDRQRVSTRSVWTASLVATLGAVALGLVLNTTYGMYWRFFDKGDQIADLDKRSYNERAFRFKVDRFAGDGRLKLFVVGNSFGRDVVNMVDETYGATNYDIVYSDTAPLCIGASGAAQQSLFDAADVIVFASGDYVGAPGPAQCTRDAIAWAEARGKRIFFVGTKDFGYNMNWLIQVPRAERANRSNRLSEDTARIEAANRAALAPRHYVSLLAPVVRNGRVPITDPQGKVISTDRSHVTKFGAIFFGERALKPSALGAVLEAARPPHPVVPAAR